MKSTKLRRSNRKVYFKEQDETTRRFVVPYILNFHQINRNTRVLEIGCGEGGNLKYFVEKGCEVVGIDLSKKQLNAAKIFLHEFCEDDSRLTLINENIYNVNPKDLGTFDIIMMRDVIEHIPNQEKFMSLLHCFIKPTGIVFFGFPPWQMPFGGHQQGASSILKAIPYFHILPNTIYKRILKVFGESEAKINSLLQTKSTGISIERFKKIAIKTNWKIVNETFFLINPNYDVKFNLKPKKQFKIIAKIPFFRNFLTSCAYYILSSNEKIKNEA